MKIRKIKLSDSETITKLLDQLGYSDTNIFIKNKIKDLMDDPNEILVVAEDQGNVLAFISIHFIPQIALVGDFARISYFSVDENYRSNGLGKMLEEYCEKEAKLRNCDRIEVHCHSRREKAHKFYFRQGYIESPKYLIKPLK
jgi:GNAT superfamily N-acetyltransferase